MKVRSLLRGESKLYHEQQKSHLIYLLVMTHLSEWRSLGVCWIIDLTWKIISLIFTLFYINRFYITIWVSKSKYFLRILSRIIHNVLAMNILPSSWNVTDSKTATPVSSSTAWSPKELLLKEGEQNWENKWKYRFNDKRIQRGRQPVETRSHNYF